jgi:hypothetical protein
MRMLVEVEFPIEPFNTLVKKGSAGQVIQKILGEIKPEAAYFTARDGHRGCVLVVNLTDPAKIPAIAEPFFLQLNATVKLLPCMTPEDLGKAGLDALGKTWG